MVFTLSDLLGYTSIGCWLGAQFPQIIENMRRQSVEGLALPFLANWMLGDLSNLIGCILTHQLPFQTYLATYFCFVDVCLLSQYLYYREPSKPAGYHPIRTRTASVATQRRLSIERAPTRYRTLSNVAANVAAAAALAAQQEEQARWRRESVERPRRSATVDNFQEVELGEDDEVDDETLARLADSFHSEGGRSSRRKTVAWSGERRGGSLGRTRQSTLSPLTHHRHLHMTTSPPPSADTHEFPGRGRPQARESGDEGEDGEWSASSAHRRSSRASRKGATMVFMGMWALFGLGTLAGSKRGVPLSTGLRIGRVLTFDKPHPALVADAGAIFEARDIPATFHPHPPHSTKDPHSSSHPPLEEPGPSMEYIIGRISAWTCTTLYLTSRLPQIWKNFARKSVEGLSMFLFVSAFLGNFFYVASILTSPKLSLPPHEASAFLRESIPYLLGSGGTLMFDVTIVTQSFIYRPKGHIRGRRVSHNVSEEEAGLLSAGATGAEDPSTPSRRRVLLSETEEDSEYHTR